MYVSLRNRPATAAGRTGRQRRRAVPRTVLLLGFTSLFTDVSSEMITAVLPLFLTLQLGLSPAQFGLIDGLYNGVSAVSRLAAGVASDRLGKPKLVATVGYGLSALTRPLLLLASSVTAVAALVSADRLGKGIRTAPRDAMIAGASRPRELAYNFGIHRAMDNVGAMLGPLIAFGLLLLLPGQFDAVFVVSSSFALLGLAVLVLLVQARPRRTAPPRPPRATKPSCGPDDEHTDSCPTWGNAFKCRTCGSASAAAGGLHRSKLTWSDLTALFGSRQFTTRVGIAGLLTAFSVSDAFIFLTLLQRDEGLARVFPLFAVGLALSYALLSVPVGRLADRLGRMKVYLGGHVLLVGVYAVAGGLTAIPAVLLTVLLLGLFYAATDGVLAASVSAALPDVSRASGLAAAQTVVALAAFASSVGFGLLLTWLGLTGAYAVMGIGLTAGMLVAWRFLKRAPVPVEAG